MSINLNVTISGTAGLGAGPFDIYHTPINPSSDGNLVISGVSRATLLSPGQTISVPDGTTIIRVRSTGSCTDYDDATIPCIVTPTATPTSTPSTPTPTPTEITPTPTPTEITPTPTPTEMTSTPTPTPTPTPTEITPTPTPTEITPTPTPTPDTKTDLQYEVNAYSNNIRYEVSYSNGLCIYSGTCGLGNKIIFNDITSCSTGCTGNTELTTTIHGEFLVTWDKTRNQTGTCTTGPCYAEDLTYARIYINGSEATSFGSPFIYDGPMQPGGAALVTGNVTLTGITINDTVLLLITEG